MTQAGEWGVTNAGKQVAKGQLEGMKPCISGEVVEGWGFENGSVLVWFVSQNHFNPTFA